MPVTFRVTIFRGADTLAFTAGFSWVIFVRGLTLACAAVTDFYKVDGAVAFIAF